LFLEIVFYENISKKPSSTLSTHHRSFGRYTFSGLSTR